MDTQLHNHRHREQTLHTNSFIRNNSMNIDTIKQLCHEQVTTLGFDYVSYVGYNPVNEEIREFSTFPAEWFKQICIQYGVWDNPIARFSQNKNTLFFWQDAITKPGENSPILAGFLALSQKHHIHNGICFPIHGAGAEWGMFNIARRQDQQNISLESVEILQLYALTVHEAVKRANDYGVKEQTNQKLLSPRERECLSWIAAGKTAWETAKIIGVSESTVSFHVRNTIVKLNSKNRAQAVAVAMARSIIKLPNKDQIRTSNLDSPHNNQMQQSNA